MSFQPALPNTMGKGGSAKGKKKSNAAAEASGPSDDALLDAAIAENATLKAAAAAQAEEAKAKEAAKAAIKIAQAKFKNANAPKSELLTLEQTLGKLDRIMSFTIIRLLGSGLKDMAPGADGHLVFYVDARDAQAALAALKTAHPEAKLALDHVPLGRAFALTQGLMGLRTPAPSRIQFSQSVVEAEGDKESPRSSARKWRLRGPSRSSTATSWATTLSRQSSFPVMTSETFGASVGALRHEARGPYDGVGPSYRRRTHAAGARLLEFAILRAVSVSPSSPMIAPRILPKRSECKFASRPRLMWRSQMESAFLTCLFPACRCTGPRPLPNWLRR